jgi:hypothetical protein
VPLAWGDDVNGDGVIAPSEVSIDCDNPVFPEPSFDYDWPVTESPAAPPAGPGFTAEWLADYMSSATGEMSGKLDPGVVAEDSPAWTYLEGTGLLFDFGPPEIGEGCSYTVSDRTVTAGSSCPSFSDFKVDEAGLLVDMSRTLEDAAATPLSTVVVPVDHTEAVGDATVIAHSIRLFDGTVYVVLDITAGSAQVYAWCQTFVLDGRQYESTYSPGDVFPGVHLVDTNVWETPGVASMAGGIAYCTAGELDGNAFEEWTIEVPQG